MTDFTILVQNKSGISRAYFLFVKPPAITGAQASDIFQCCYQTARPVPNGTGTAQFHIHKDNYAVTGTSPAPLSPMINVATGDFELVTLSDASGKGTATYMTVDEGGVRFMPQKLTQSVAQTGTFSISTDKSFNYPNQG